MLFGERSEKDFLFLFHRKLADRFLKVKIAEERDKWRRNAE